MRGVHASVMVIDLWIYRRLFAFTGVHSDLSALTRIYQRLHELIGAHPDLSAPARTYRRLLRFISVCTKLSAPTSLSHLTFLRLDDVQARCTRLICSTTRPLRPVVV